MAGRTIKFQLMLSPGEAAAIDDWMFQNRLKSRAEAIRQLCALSLKGSAYNQMRQKMATDDGGQ